MVALGATNWLIVAGLVFALLGALTLAGAINMGTRADPQDLERYHRAGGHQRAGTAFAGLFLSIGTGLMLLGQFFTATLGPTMVLVLLGIVPLLVVYLFTWDQAGERASAPYRGMSREAGSTTSTVVESAPAPAVAEPKLKVAV